MAAPLIVGASRTVGKKVVERSTRDLEGGMERSRKVRKLEARANGYQGRRMDGGAIPKNRQPIPHVKGEPRVKKASLPNSESVLTKKARAVTASYNTLWVAMPLWGLEFCVWAFGMVGLGIEKIPGANILYPGVTLFEFSFYFIGILGIITLIFIAGVFAASRVDCFSGWKLIIFAITFCLYWLTFLGLFPWFMLWLAAVIHLQNED